MTNGKRWLWIVGLLFLAFPVLGCSDTLKNVEPTGEAQPYELPYRYEEKVLKWSFGYPDNWQVVEDEAEQPGETDIPLGGFTEANIIVKREDGKGVADPQQMIMISFMTDLSASELAYFPDNSPSPEIVGGIPTGKMLASKKTNYVQNKEKYGLKFYSEVAQSDGLINVQYFVGTSRGVVLISTQYASEAIRKQVEPEVIQIASSIKV